MRPAASGPRPGESVFSQCANLVLYCPVLPDPPEASIRPRGVTRRAALAAAATLALAGCTSTPARAQPTGVTVSSDALGPLYTETLALISLYDQNIAAYPALAALIGPLREDHRQHAIAIASLMRIVAPAVSIGPDAGGLPMPPVTASPATAAPIAADSAPARATLSAAEATAKASAVAACLSAPADRSAVLASIAACRATHVAVLG